jgi:hypothetical protein
MGEVIRGQRPLGSKQDNLLKEGTVANWRRSWFKAAISLLFISLMCTGCAGVQQPRTEKLVVTENLLQRAGFKPWNVNEETPKRRALLSTLPPGTIVTYRRNGQIYHVYGDENTNTLYVGDAAAYQKYLSLAKGEQLCGRVEGTNTEKFWSCFEEYQRTGGQQGK